MFEKNMRPKAVHPPGIQFMLLKTQVYPVVLVNEQTCDSL